MTFTQPRVLTLAILAATLGLTACNSNDDDGSLPGAAVTMKTVTIVPSLGKISNARVVLRNAATRAKLDDVPLVNGEAISRLIPSNVPVVLAELLPNANTEYFDEAVADDPATLVNESLRRFPLNRNLRTVFEPAAGGRVGMTPLTEAAFQRAEALAGAGRLNATLIRQANAYIQSVFGVANILQAPFVVGSQQDYVALLAASNASKEYALRLAALARQGRTGLPGADAPAVEMMHALALDLADGKLNGAGQGLPAQLPYNHAAFGAAWAQAMTDLVNAVIAALGTGQNGLTDAQKNALLDLAANIRNNLRFNPDPGGNGNGAATVAAGLAGNYTLVYDEIKTGGIYQDNQQVPFVVGANGTLNVNGKSLSNPYYAVLNGVPFTGEVLWDDGNITYALSNNTNGVFNEINVSDKTKTPSFMGQFTKVAVVGGQTCSSQGADNTVGFSGAPDDFCGFTRASSSMITAPDSFTFVSADADKRYLKVDVVNNVPQRVQVENSAYSFSCGGGNPACANIVFTTNGNIRQFNFTNTVLTADNGSGKTLTLKDGNVIHQIQGGVNQPLRTENGVEIYDCATWKLIPNGAATSNVSLNFINQRGNFKSITINGLNSINRSVLLFGNLQNGGTRTLAGLHNQMVMVDDSAGTCLAVLKPVTAGDKNVTFNADDSVSVSSVVAPPPAGVTITLNENACSGGIPTLRQNCGVTTTNDFSINNLKTVNGGTDCTLTKNGGNVTVNLNGKSITASLNAEAGDSLSLLAGGDRLIVANTSGTSVSYRVNPAGNLVHSEVTSLPDAVIAERCTF